MVRALSLILLGVTAVGVVATPALVAAALRHRPVRGARRRLVDRARAATRTRAATAAAHGNGARCSDAC